MLDSYNDLKALKIIECALLAYEGSSVEFEVISKYSCSEDNIKRFNYLISLQDDFIRCYLWNNLKIFDSDDINFYENIDATLLSEDAKSLIRERINSWYAIENREHIHKNILTPRLILRPASAKDWQIFFDQFLSSNDFEMYSGVKKNEQTIKQYVYNICYCLNYFVIEEIATGEVVGYCAINVLDDKLDIGIIEYFIFEKYRRKGYGKEACSALINKAFSGCLFTLFDTNYKDLYEEKYLQLNSIIAFCSNENKSSNEVLKSLKFTFVDAKNKKVDYKDEPICENLYCLENQN
jgi:RimJ/RimL family protein N-acetyltransferase